MFRLPTTLTVGQQYTVVSAADAAALESYLPRNSRVLVGLIFSERYDGFEEDCERAELKLREQAGLLPWPEYQRFVTPDPDGQPIVWVSYLSSPAWWTILLVILASIFLLPILSAFSMWIVEKMFPGITELITMTVVLMMVGGVMLFMPKLMAPAKEEK